MSTLQFAADYLRHRLQSKTRHGVHSPFVYQLVDEVIYDFRAKADYATIEQLRAVLKQDQRTITITDLGAGSHVNNNKQKAVKTLAKNALKPPHLAQLIYRLANRFQPNNVVELGTCLGLTTAYLSAAVPNAALTTMEGCPETAAVAKENLEKLNIKNAEIQVGNFDHLLPQYLSKQDQIDFMFIDGNHRKDATIDYFQQSLPKVHEGSVLIFDDIYWSKGMKEAWKTIKSHPQVTCTVDLFWIGLVFFRKGQAKEHFKIRY